MRSRFNSRVVPILLVSLLGVALGPPTAAVAGVEGKGGFFDASFDRSFKVGTRFVQWLWWPNYAVGSTPYVVYAFCERHDENGEPTGKNKVVFKNVTLRGVDTDTEVTLRRKSTRLRDGMQPAVLTWDAGELGTIAHETAIIGSCDVKVKGSVDANDLVHCEIGTAEVTGP